MTLRMGERKKYHFKLSTTYAIISALFILAIGLMLVVTYPYNRWWVIAINAVAVIITIYFIAISPRYWVLTDEGLKLTRLLSPPLFFPSKEYTIKSANSSQISSSIRVLGSGGFMGALGLFHSQELGFFTLYVTDAKEPLLLIKRKRDGKNIVMNGII